MQVVADLVDAVALMKYLEHRENLKTTKNTTCIHFAFPLCVFTKVEKLQF